MQLRYEFTFLQIQYLARIIGISLLLFMPGAFAYADIATSTVTVSICGDAIVNGGEACDDGALDNDAGYATSAATRRCNASCSGFGPYCANNILEPYYGEE